MPLTLEQRIALVGTPEVMWTRVQAAAYLGISVRQLALLPVPRCNFATGVRYMPEVVRDWARRQASHALPPTVQSTPHSV